MGNCLLYFDKTHVWATRRSRDSHSLYQGGQGRPCSHSISYSQIVSLPVSIFSDAYFIQRDEDNSDPDPELKMVAMRIFPWMLIVVIHSITVWTCIAALLGEYVIPCICVSFLLTGFLIFANLQANNWRQMSLVIFYIDFVCSLFTFVGILSWILFHLLSYLMPRTDCVITSYFVFCILWGVPVIFVFYAKWWWKHLEKSLTSFSCHL